MKTAIEDFNVEIPNDYEKIPLPFYNEWIMDLETPTAGQAHGELERNGKYCCLGRLCLITDRLNKYEHKTDCGLMTSHPCFPALGYVGLLPSEVKISSSLGRKTESLAAVNDRGMSFVGIAAIIKLLYKPVK